MQTRKSRPSERGIRVKPHREVIKINGFEQSIARVITACFKNQSAQVRIVSLRIVCGVSSQRQLLTAGQLRLQRRCYSFSDLTLDAKNVIQLSIVRLGPELRTGLHVNQVNIHSYLSARFLDAALNDVPYAELLCDFGKIALFALISLGGNARNYFQICDLSKTRQDFFLDAIGEISVVGITA